MKWTLQDRLDKAAADRRLAAGLPADTSGPSGAAATGPAEPSAGGTPTDPATIDLRTPEPAGPIEPGAPGAFATERARASGGDPLPNRRDGGGGLPLWQGADQPPRDTAWHLSSAGTTLTSPPPRPASPTSPTDPGATPRADAAPDNEPLPSTAPLKDRCPNCRGAVRLDMFDLVEAVAHMSCVDCGFLYTTKSPKL